MRAKDLLRSKYIRMLSDAVTAWWNDQAPSKGAALAYYSMFSIAPLLYLIISIAGLFFGPDAVRGMVSSRSPRSWGATVPRRSAKCWPTSASPRPAA